jgi:hypothetical protein
MLHRLAQIIAAALHAIALALSGVRTWSRGRIVAVTCIGPFLAVILSALGHPVLAVLAFAAGVVFFNAAVASSAPPSPPETPPENPTDLEA